MSEKIQKERVRKSLLARRSRIPEDRYRSKSEAIRERLKQMDWYIGASTVHCYASMNNRREPDTFPLLEEMIEEGRRVVVPVTNVSDKSLRHLRLRSTDRLRPNSWGVPEPPDGEEVPLHEFELVIVPMVGGDRMRNRLGYGQGFYDRFLAKVDCPTVGLLFEECYVNELPAEPFDVRLGAIVTDRQVICGDQEE